MMWRWADRLGTYTDGGNAPAEEGEVTRSLLQRNSEIPGCIIPTASMGGGRPTSRSQESMSDQGARAVTGKERGLATTAHSSVNGCVGRELAVAAHRTARQMSRGHGEGN